MAFLVVSTIHPGEELKNLWGPGLMGKWGLAPSNLEGVFHHGPTMSTNGGVGHSWRAPTQSGYPLEFCT